MQQQISVITLGVAELARSRRFYADGFGWKPVLETPDIIFYQMNGLMLGTWLASSLADDSRRPPAPGPAPSRWPTTSPARRRCSRRSTIS